MAPRTILREHVGGSGSGRVAESRGGTASEGPPLNRPHAGPGHRTAIWMSAQRRRVQATPLNEGAAAEQPALGRGASMAPRTILRERDRRAAAGGPRLTGRGRGP